MNEFDIGAEVRKETPVALENVRQVLIKFEQEPEFKNWIAVKRLVAALNKRVIGREGQ